MLAPSATLLSGILRRLNHSALRLRRRSSSSGSNEPLSVVIANLAIDEAKQSVELTDARPAAFLKAWDCLKLERRPDGRIRAERPRFPRPRRGEFCAPGGDGLARRHHRAAGARNDRTRDAL